MSDFFLGRKRLSEHLCMSSLQQQVDDNDKSFFGTCLAHVVVVVGAAMEEVSSAVLSRHYCVLANIITIEP